MTAAGSPARRSRVRDAAPGSETSRVHLLDVNVLVALIDPMHTHHEAAHRFMLDVETWATCPITENGVIRIVGSPRYPGNPGSPAQVAGLLGRMQTQRAGHRFWPGDVSLIRNPNVDASRLRVVGQVTDTYLLALAVQHGGKLATFDRRLVADAVKGGREALHLVG